MRSEKEFDWFEETGEFGFDDLEEPVSTEKGAMSNLAGKLWSTSVAVLILSPVVALVLKALPERFRYFEGYDLLEIAVVSLILSGSLVAIRAIANLLIKVITQTSPRVSRFLNKTVKTYVILSVWLFFDIWLTNKFDFVHPKRKYFIIRLCICGLITTGFFAVKALFVEVFRNYFIHSTLKSKISDMEFKESVMHTLKTYCYEDVESESEESTTCFIFDCLEDEVSKKATGAGADSFEIVQGTKGFLHTFDIESADMLSLHETKALARDVFSKCSGDKTKIDFDEFCQMFPDVQSAIQAFLYFDTNGNNEISKKELRDTMVKFYHERSNLDKSFRSLCNFVEILDECTTIILILPLLIFHLAFLGLPIKQLLTFSLSSALILNFMISGVAKDFYLNASVVLSHPFDIGDDVLIDDKDYSVYSVGLYKTEFLSPHGGKVSFFNKTLWDKNVINMSRAPQKLIKMNFKLDSSITTYQFKELQKRLLFYLRERNKIFYETFSIQSQSETSCTIDSIDCSVIVRCKSAQTKMSKLEIKVELVKALMDIFEDLCIVRI